ncbi:MAG: transcription-repair coupling factor [Desulfobulbus propionicus]|nr:MAG: transcription-repair coupling factor [Desulfobulbus propionicus]
MQSILKRLCTGSSLPADVTGLNNASTALLLSRAVEALEHTVCCILPSDDQLESFSQDISVFTSTPVLMYPSFEIPPYTPLSPDPVTVGTRLSTLYQLQDNNAPVIILASAEAILRRILPKTVLSSHSELVITGEEFDRDELIRTLTSSGYQHCELVQQQGDLAVRGGIMDIYPPGFHHELPPGPLRLDFFGDTLETMRIFDPVSQRSITELEEAILLPASDTLFWGEDAQSGWRTLFDQIAEDNQWSEASKRQLYDQLRQRVRFPGIEFFLPLLYGGTDKLDTFFDYLPQKCALFLADPTGINQSQELVFERIEANYNEAITNTIAALPPTELFLSAEEATTKIAERLHSRILQLPDPDASQPPLHVKGGDHNLLRQEIELQRKKRGLLAPLADRIIPWLNKQDTVILSCKSHRQASHFAELLINYQLTSSYGTTPLSLKEAGTGEVLLIDHPLSQGFDLPDENLHVLSAQELFGDKRLQKRRQKASAPQTGELLPLDQLNDGDIVVHREHGVGLFRGLINMEISGNKGDYLVIDYRNDDKLYVPVDKLHWVSKYQGLTDQQPRLDSLGSQRWQATKQKVTEAVWKVAQELLDIYAKRAIRQGHRFSPPGELYSELEESFPYDETPGQAQAIDDTLDDLTSERPMDRLVCGDVGYGKTEVAARAAFKVIEDGYQVALLVPTTVLAEQHAATFRDRFTSFPVEIRCLNRFRTTKEQREITAGISDSSVDLVVGTHRLLSKDIQFKRLGLLIIDEEHRFGVSHKEKIKKLKASVEVLTLTATPIPRTLQMSLLGIRDLSVISTPPRQRRAVKTFLAKHDQLVIREAVLKEMQRGGQIYFVHNRVKTIHRMAETIRQLVPHARIGVGHGQMTGQQLEEVMVQFINHKIDILVCTTIIESGLDIPNANTIIINRADHLGLADIYQLRGRVGRSTRQAYAYLFVPSLESLSGDAKKRLRALMDNTELGGGFTLAMNDLQIRGGGNLLGVSQSGHIAAVGYDLYLELLQATVADLKKQAVAQESGEVTNAIDPEVKLQLSVFIPDDYIPDTAQRYQAYRRISALSNGTWEELQDLADELKDRYGVLPEEVSNLFQIIELKQRLRLLWVTRLEQSSKALVFHFSEQNQLDPQRLITLVQQGSGKKKKQPAARLTPDHKLIIELDQKKGLPQQINAVLNILEGE